jgi:hypothetical protein
VTSSTTSNTAIAVQPPCGQGGAGASAALALLHDVTTSPASRRLASAPATPGTRPLLILGQAPSGASAAATGKNWRSLSGR